MFAFLFKIFCWIDRFWNPLKKVRIQPLSPPNPGPAKPSLSYQVGPDTFVPVTIHRPFFLGHSNDQGVINTALAAAYADFLVTEFWKEHWHQWKAGNWEELVLNLQDALDRAQWLQEHFAGFVQVLPAKTEILE